MRALPILSLLLICLAAYCDAVAGHFVYDDMAQVVQNPWIRNIGNLPLIFTRSAWSFQPDVTSNYYRPLMFVVYMIDYHLFGLHPWGFHSVNILLHWGATVLVFLVIRRLLAEHSVSASPRYLSPPFIGALLLLQIPSIPRR